MPLGPTFRGASFLPQVSLQVKVKFIQASQLKLQPQLQAPKTNPSPTELTVENGLIKLAQFPYQRKTTLTVTDGV